MKLRLGLIGLGPLWESRYRPALRALSDRFQVTAVFEQVAHRAVTAAREFDASPVSGVRALAQRADVDAVLLLSKQWMGTLPIFAAADAGKAIYCANHLDLQHDEAERLRTRVNDAGIAFMSELPRRHAPATIRLKELIATKLGKPHLLFGHIRRPSERRPTGKPHAWSPPPHESPLADLVEQVDWVRYVVGREPTSVIGLTHRAFTDPGRQDYEMMSVDFSPVGE
ncbi:MAG TPA: Gfo/Idh/MocA family oxidoreductase, partial [Pirellulales bacterium]